MGAGRAQGEAFWTLLFTFDAWRIQGEQLQTRPLTLRRPVTDEELAGWRSLIQPYAVIAIEARVASGNPFALLEDFLGPETSDDALQDHATQLQVPVTYEDPALGTFTLQRQVGSFTAQALWDGKPISLSLSATEPDEVQEALKAAHALWEDQDGWNQRVRDYAVQMLLPLKNGTWLDDEEAGVSPDEFKERMTVEAVSVDADGLFDFWHDDGALFGGHCIQVSGSLAEGPTHADIPG